MVIMDSSINDIIQHDGIVQKTDKGSVLVRIISESACSGCHSKGACGMSGKEEKLINITGNYGVSVGDPVTVIMKKSMGYRAVLLGYVLPFFLVIITLVIFNSFSFSEPASGVMSIAILVPYYALMFLLRKQIDREFTFTLKN